MNYAYKKSRRKKKNATKIAENCIGGLKLFTGKKMTFGSAKEFAALNGWRLTKRDFNAVTLMNNRVGDNYRN
jgi:hypothetical protein